jgi:lysosomal alpha-mannosidase
MMAKLLIASVAVAALLVGVHATQGCEDSNPWPYGGKNILRVGGTLASGDSLESKTAKLTMQPDGNLVLRRKRDNQTLWITNTDTICKGAKAVLTSTQLQLNAPDFNGTNPCWSVNLNTTGILVVQDWCAVETYQEAPLTNLTWASNAPGCVVAHIVPHSHDDVGWLLSPERYYDGCRTPGGGVKGILDTIMASLLANSNRTFNQVESYFFNRWWNEQTDTMKASVRTLVANGQLVFLNGGWSMHDEACVHQESAISNMEVGARFLKEELGVEMNIGWHIDPFGHASATPRYMAEMGFDAFFFWRTDYEQRQHHLNTKTMETVWDNSPSLGDKTLMFTSIMFNNYCYGCSSNTCPSQFFSYACEYYDPYSLLAHAGVQKQSSLANLDRKFGVQSAGIPPSVQALAEAYVQNILSYTTGFRHGLVLMPWGCDFGHEDADQDYYLMDQVMEFINANYATYGIDIFYSTAPNYINAVKAMDYQWPVNKFDYFLDSDGPTSYWSGYLSSRAEFKGYERYLMNERTGIEIALSSLPTHALNLSVQLARADDMRQALGVAQHHDSITGTERTPVRNQYQHLLNRGFDNISLTLADAINASLGVAPMPCKLANLSYCPLTDVLAQSQEVSVYLFNPLAQNRTEIVTIPLPVNTVEAYLMPANTPLPIQIVSTWELTTTADETSPEVPSHSPYQAYIEVTMGALSLVEVKLVATTTVNSGFRAGVPLPTDAPTVIANDFYKLTFDPVSQRVSAVTNLLSGITSQIDQNIGHYCPYPKVPHEQTAGAYIMRTCDLNEKVAYYAENFTATVVSGPLCTEVRQVIDEDSNIQQAFRLCRGQDFVEIQSGIGEVKTLGTGVEVIMTLATDVDSQGIWYTDSQALEMQQRVRNSRPNYPYTVTEPIASNFFPCNAFAFMNSSNASIPKNVAVMGDRSRATASINDGELQFLVQRRLIYDDNRGVNEPLDERTRVLSTSRVVFNSDDLASKMRLSSLRQTHRPLVRFAAPSNSTQAPKHFNTQQMGDLLPTNVHLHTRTVHAPGEMILRLQHLFAVGEGPLAVPVTFNVTSVLPLGMKVVSVTDMDMNTVKVAANMQRIAWPTCDAGNLRTVPSVSIGGSSPLLNANSAEILTLAPMEIRVLRLNYTY